ncbi:ketoacyl-ACP synthase III [Candidatus Parcubacteria bacterium]|nr:MAG: ketoacyl-ACP synthase III [Candidatus Parcubacteria bacterium]
MIGIEAIGTYLPEQRIDNRRRMGKFGVDEEFLKIKTGMLRLAAKRPDEETSDMCCNAFMDLQQKHYVNIEKIDCIVVCTQNPDDAGLPHVSAIVHAKLGLPDTCAAFDISLGCSGFVYGLSVIQGFMIANGFRKGLLFTADPYSKVIDKEDKNTALLFGDGASVSLIGDDPVWRPGRFLFGTHGMGYEAIKVEKDSGMLTMNGREVFTFSATVVPENIREMLSLNGLGIDDIDCFALHQGSRFIVDTLRKRLQVDPGRVPFVAVDYGNTVSSSIPLLLNQLPDDMDTVVIAGFGVGLSWASTVLFKGGKPNGCYA